jgi:hypothetical protein
MMKMKLLLSTVLVCAILVQAIPYDVRSQEMNHDSDAEYDRFAEELNRIESEIVMDGGYTVGDGGIHGIQILLNDLEQTSHEDLIAKGRMLLFLEDEKGSAHRLEDIAEIIHKAEKSEIKQRRMRAAGTATLTTALASMALFNIFWLMADTQYARYNDAATRDDASYFQEKTQKYEALSYMFGAVGVISLSVSIPLLSVKKSKGANTRIDRD